MPGYRAPGRKSLLEIQQLDPDDESLAKYKRVLLGPLLPAVGMLGPGCEGWGRDWAVHPVDLQFPLRPKPAQRSGDQADSDVRAGSRAHDHGPHR